MAKSSVYHILNLMDRIEDETLVHGGTEPSFDRLRDRIKDDYPEDFKIYSDEQEKFLTQFIDANTEE